MAKKQRAPRLAGAASGPTIAVAESCTGGWLGQTLTSVPGVSAIFLGGVIAYADAVKRSILGVPKELLAGHGAVSRQVAAAMAEGVRRRLRSDIGMAITGIAGPDGGSRAKPVGLVWIALAMPSRTRTWRYRFPGDREAVRRAAVIAALRRLLDCLDHIPPLSIARKSSMPWRTGALACPWRWSRRGPPRAAVLHRHR